jgi:hypothetical protein
LFLVWAAPGIVSTVRRNLFGIISNFQITAAAADANPEK